MATQLKPAKTLEEFDRELAEMSIEGHWHVMDIISTTPKLAAQPWLWRWQEVYPKLMEAGEVFKLEGRGGEVRRTLRLCAPGVPIKATTRTIHVSVQLVQPGEVAPAHRHSMGAFRFIMQGHGAFTVVNGEKFPMEPGDLIITPAYSWHDHHNETDQPIIWLDGLDLPLMVALNNCFFEDYTARSHDITQPEGLTEATTAAMRPKGAASPPTGLPYRYSGDEAMRALRLLGDAAATPYDGYTLEYTNPLTGGPVMPTTACRLHLLRPGQATRRHRHTSSTIYQVVQGRGETHVGDTVLKWEKGDTFVVPMWHWHDHHAAPDGEAFLFSVSDDPLFAALGQDKMEAA